VVTRENIMKVAIAAEVNGRGILGVADHLIVPVKTGVQAASWVGGESDPSLR
jgi:hypothetical protein